MRAKASIRAGFFRYLDVKLGLMTLSQQFKTASEPHWSQATGHQFTQELANGTLDLQVFTQYLIQDYAFVETLVNMVAIATAKAPKMQQKHVLSSFLVNVSSDENTYFVRSFDTLGIAESDYKNPALTPISQAFLTELNDAAEHGYYDCISVLCCAEWVYLEWAQAVRQIATQYETTHGQPLPFYFLEWIDLHDNADFETFVHWLRAEVDAFATLDATSQARLLSRFKRMSEWEHQFFSSAYES